MATVRDPPTARDLILVICAVSLVGLGVATFVNVHRTRELTQATYDEARAVKVSTKAIEDHADAIRKDVHPHEPERALGLSAFIYRCSTSAMLASCELTNPGPKIAVACWTGFVQRKGSSDRTESVAVCTGDVKPRATVSITADYLVGAVQTFPMPGRALWRRQLG